MCSDWSVLLGKGRGKRGRRGSEHYSSESSEARQIQWRNPPSSQMNITVSLPPPPPPAISIAVFPLLPCSLLLHYSSVRWEFPAHGSSCCCSSLSIKPAGSALFVSEPGYCAHFSTHPSIIYPPSSSMETQSGQFARESKPSSSRSLRLWEEKHKRRERRIFWDLKESCSSASVFICWITVLALCRNEKTGSKMPEANYLLSVSWGYIKVCGAYLRSLSGYRTRFISRLPSLLPIHKLTFW